MNCDLHDIQDDIQKLAKQQNQIQVQAMQAQQLFQAQQIANILNQQYSSQQNIAGLYHPIQQQFGSTPHLPMKPPHHQYVNDQGQYINQQIYSRENSRIIDDQYAVSSPPTQYLNQEKQRNIAKYVQETNNYRDQFDTQQAQFFLHQEPQTPPQPPARRTWSQKAPTEMSSWSQQAQIQQHQMFQQQQHQQQMLQHQLQQQQQPPQQQQQQQQSWKSSSSSASQSEKGFVLHQNGKLSQESQAHRLFPVQHAANQQQNPPLRKVPPEEVMAPQSISFIGEEEDGHDDEPDNFNHSSRMNDLEVSLGKLNITSGSRTYRIPSPTTRNHPGLAVNSFQSIESQNDENEKGFYISFDSDTQPKRPKPPLRTKRSPKKRPVDEPVQESKNLSHQEMNSYYDDSPFKPTPDERLKQVVSSPMPQVKLVNKSKESEALIIGDEQTSSERVIKLILKISLNTFY
jgi:calmodulin-regulated spectrin-associated protein